jgi:hypothetical protein
LSDRVRSHTLAVPESGRKDIAMGRHGVRRGLARVGAVMGVIVLVPAAAMAVTYTVKPSSIKLVARTLPVSGPRAAVRLKCVGGTSSCAGRLELVVVEAGKRHQRGVMIAIDASYLIGFDRSQTVELTLLPAGRGRLAAHGGKLAALLAVTPTGGRSTIDKITLKTVKSKHRA